MEEGKRGRRVLWTSMMHVQCTTGDGEGDQTKIGWFWMWEKGESEFSNFFAGFINE